MGKCKEGLYIALVNEKGETLEEFLKNYNSEKYKKPALTVDMLLFTIMDKKEHNKKKLPDKELKIMLIKRKEHPFIFKWAIPGGFVNIDESVEEAARRELKEETNIDNVYLEQLYLFGDVKRDPRMRVISSSYMGLTPNKNLNPIAGDDAKDVKWFTIKKELVSKEESESIWNLSLVSDDEKIFLEYEVREKFRLNGTIKELKSVVSYKSGEEIAFDHIEIINLALNRLKNKIEYTSIAFNLINESFTLTELQKVYEIILCKKIRKSNFRKKIEDMVCETGQVYSSGGYRPPKLYKFNSNWKNEF